VQEAYHRARTALYRTIIAESRLPRDARVLDAGCGDGYYSELLAEELGPRAQVVAADTNLATLRSRPRLAAGVERCLTDVECPGLRSRSFDVVWMCRTMHSAPDPQQRVGALVALLRPGGRLIAVEDDPFHCPILAWPDDFEVRVQRALDQLFRQRCRGGASIDRYHAPRHLPAWLAAAGLDQVTVRTHPVDDTVPMAADVETYWRLWMEQRGELIRPFLSSADWRTYRRAFDLHGREYVLRQPGMRCHGPTTVACGVAP
jgi:SAM-dependent methyltransferase